MADLAGRLDHALKTAGAKAVPPWTIVGVSISDPANKATWKVNPSNLQAAAQPTIDAFDPNDPVHLDAELDAAVKSAVDTERLTSAIVWTIIDTYSPPATIAKYNTARAKIITAYKAQPWRP